MHDTDRKSCAVIVIGVGASGLAAAQALRERGIPVRIIDKAMRVGEAWYHRHPQLRMNTHRHLSGLPGLAMPKAMGAFPSRDNIIRYLGDYAAQLDVPIDHGVEVTRIDRVGKGWAVKTSAGTYSAHHVVVATGHDRVPHVPDWTGRETFEKELVHAADFGDLADYRSRKILVVGAGNSGTDILNHLATIETDRVWVSVRHGPVVFPVRLCGVPVQHLSAILASLPVRIVDGLLALTEYIAFGNLAKWGLHKHPQGGATRLLKTGTAPAIDNGFITALKAGKMTVVPEIERFETASVRLIDGQYIEPDIVIAATGYRTGLEPMLGHINVLNELRIPVIHGAQQLAAYHGLWFTGMRPRLPGFFYMAGKTAREIANAIDDGREFEGSAMLDGAIDLATQNPAAQVSRQS